MTGPRSRPSTPAATVPSPVFVVQVKRRGQGRGGPRRAREVLAGRRRPAGWAISDGWAVLAETDEIADGVVRDADAAPLSDDADFQQWSGAAGDAGIVSMYAAPEAGEYLGRLAEMGTPGAMGSSSASGTVQQSGLMTGDPAEAFKDFQGAPPRSASRTAPSSSSSPPTPRDRQGRLPGDHGDDTLATCPTTPPQPSASASRRAGSRTWSTSSPRCRGRPPRSS